MVYVFDWLIFAYIFENVVIVSPNKNIAACGGLTFSNILDNILSLLYNIDRTYFKASAEVSNVNNATRPFHWKLVNLNVILISLKLAMSNIAMGGSIPYILACSNL